VNHIVDPRKTRVKRVFSIVKTPSLVDPRKSKNTRKVLGKYALVIGSISLFTAISQSGSKIPTGYKCFKSAQGVAAQGLGGGAGASENSDLFCIIDENRVASAVADGPSVTTAESTQRSYNFPGADSHLIKSSFSRGKSYYSSAPSNQGGRHIHVVLVIVEELSNKKIKKHKSLDAYAAKAYSDLNEQKNIEKHSDFKLAESMFLPIKKIVEKTCGTKITFDVGRIAYPGSLLSPENGDDLDEPQREDLVKIRDDRIYQTLSHSYKNKEADGTIFMVLVDSDVGVTGNLFPFEQMKPDYRQKVGGWETLPTQSQFLFYNSWNSEAGKVEKTSKYHHHRWYLTRAVARAALYPTKSNPLYPSIVHLEQRQVELADQLSQAALNVEKSKNIVNVSKVDHDPYELFNEMRENYFKVVRDLGEEMDIVTGVLPAHLMLAKTEIAEALSKMASRGLHPQVHRQLEASAHGRLSEPLWDDYRLNEESYCSDASMNTRQDVLMAKGAKAWD